MVRSMRVSKSLKLALVILIIEMQASDKIIGVVHFDVAVVVVEQFFAIGDFF